MNNIRFKKKYWITIGIITAGILILIFAHPFHPKLPPLSQARELYLAALSYETDIKETEGGHNFSKVPTLQELINSGYLKRPSLKEWQREFDVSFYTDSSQMSSGLPPGKRMFIKMVRRKDMLTIIISQDGAINYYLPGNN